MMICIGLEYRRVLMQAYEILLAQLSTAENLVMTACSGARWRLTFGDKVYL